MDEASNTGSNRKPGTFTRADPRINRKGRPKVFDALRELALEVAHETALTNGEPIILSGHKVTVIEAIMRQWAQSKDMRKQQAFVEIAFGKVPDKLDVTTGGEKIDSIDGAAIAEALHILGGSHDCPGG